MRRTESIIALRSEPIKNIFPLLPSIIGPDVRDLILRAKTICDTPCDCNYLLVFLDLFLEMCTTPPQHRPQDCAWVRISSPHPLWLRRTVLWIIWRWCTAANAGTFLMDQYRLKRHQSKSDPFIPVPCCVSSAFVCWCCCCSSPFKTAGLYSAASHCESLSKFAYMNVRYYLCAAVSDSGFRRWGWKNTQTHMMIIVSKAV